MCVLFFSAPPSPFLDSALRFLDRIAKELELPMKKIEVIYSMMWRWYAGMLSAWDRMFPSSLVFVPSGVSGQSCVDHDVGRDETHPEVHPAELPHRRCTCLPGTSLSSVLWVFCPVLTWNRWVKNRPGINLFSRSIGNTMLSVLSKMLRATFMPVDHRTWNVWLYSGYLNKKKTALIACLVKQDFYFQCCDLHLCLCAMRTTSFITEPTLLSIQTFSISQNVLSEVFVACVGTFRQSEGWRRRDGNRHALYT